jgi:hypothetical protein
MKNHFHFLVRIKEIDEINNNELYTPVRVQNPDRGVQPKKPHLYFSHLFNSYTQAYNKMYNRTGTLFERPFHRIKIENEKYLRNLIFYIHNNPVHHGFTDHINDYPWSSYQTIISTKETKIKRKETIEVFDDLANFKTYHLSQPSLVGMDYLLID